MPLMDSHKDRFEFFDEDGRTSSARRAALVADRAQHARRRAHGMVDRNAARLAAARVRARAG
jgi:hypothetical protein